MNTELACKPEAAFATEAIPCSGSPLSAAANAMAAKKHRTFFMNNPLWSLFKQTTFVSFIPLQLQGMCPQSSGPNSI